MLFLHNYFKYVNGAVVEGSAWLNMLEKIGFRKCGITVRGKNDMIQPLNCNLDECGIKYNDLLVEACSELVENGILLNVEL